MTASSRATQAAHTPGPWNVSRIGDGFEVEDASARTIAQTQQLTPTRTAADHNERRANAHLIAAAPDLLAALIAVVSVADRKTDEFDLAHAAIAKAKQPQKGLDVCTQDVHQSGLGGV